MAAQIEPASEFQKLPLEMVVGTPLVAIAKAQAIAAQATLDFVNGLCDAPGADNSRKPKTIDISIERQSAGGGGAGAGGNAGGTTTAVIKAPLLSIVPIPHLLIDSATINFKYEIAQTFVDKSQTSTSADLKIGTTGILSKFVEATFHGNVAHTSSSEASTNRGGTLDIMIRASQSAIPVGLDRLITMLSQTIAVP